MAVHRSPQTEWGFAGVTGPYNDTQVGDVEVDERRWVHLIMMDGKTAWGGFSLAGEAAVALIDVPPTLRGLYAEDQWGVSVEASRVLLDPVIPSFKHTALSFAVRAEAVDLDRAEDGDSRQRLSASLNLRRRPYSVVRFGWYYEVMRDRFANDTPGAGLTLTAATYF